MDALKERELPMSVMLDRVILRLMLLALAGILTAAMAIHLAVGKFPADVACSNAQRGNHVRIIFGLTMHLATGGPTSRAYAQDPSARWSRWQTSK